MKVTGIIPCRMNSTRFPGKPLVEISGVAMIERVYLQAKKAGKLNSVFVATDSREIESFCISRTLPVIMTGECKSGSDRVYKACKGLETDVVVNIQGDEPLIRPDVIQSVVEPFYVRDDVEIVTARKEITRQNEINDCNVVKTVCDEEGFALYFSRRLIPFSKSKATRYFKHIGIYAYTKRVLEEFTLLPESRLEKAESLEQLRFLENGYKIYTVLTDYDSVGVDVPEDVAQVEKILRDSEPDLL